MLYLVGRLRRSPCLYGWVSFNCLRDFRATDGEEPSHGCSRSAAIGRPLLIAFLVKKLEMFGSLGGYATFAGRKRS